MVKVLAQNRQRDRRAGSLQIVQAALEKRLVGEHAERSGSAGLIGARDARRIEIMGENALARRGLLDLGNDGRRAGRESGAEIAASGQAHFGFALPCFQGRSDARQVLAFFGHNTGQNVWNGIDQGCCSNGIKQPCVEIALRLKVAGIS